MTSNKGTSLNAAASYIFNEERILVYACADSASSFLVRFQNKGYAARAFSESVKRQTFWLHFLPPHWKIKILFHDYLLRNNLFISLKFPISVKWMLA